jgi:hypothetical protein
VDIKSENGKVSKSTKSSDPKLSNNLDIESILNNCTGLDKIRGEIYTRMGI